MFTVAAQPRHHLGDRIYSMLQWLDIYEKTSGTKLNALQMGYANMSITILQSDLLPFFT